LKQRGLAERQRPIGLRVGARFGGESYRSRLYAPRRCNLKPLLGRILGQLAKNLKYFNDFNVSLAETEGFEPSIQCYPYNALAKRRLQPLGHVSNAAQACTPEANRNATGSVAAIRYSLRRLAGPTTRQSCDGTVRAQCNCLFDIVR
jgi:hypothetical protein